jgi:hypothetical protein
MTINPETGAPCPGRRSRSDPLVTNSNYLSAPGGLSVSFLIAKSHLCGPSNLAFVDWTGPNTLSKDQGGVNAKVRSHTHPALFQGCAFRS